MFTGESTGKAEEEEEHNKCSYNIDKSDVVIIHLYVLFCPKRAAEGLLDQVHVGNTALENVLRKVC